MSISDDFKTALMECFNEAASGGIEQDTKENALALEQELSAVEIFDLCAQIGVIEEEALLEQLEAQTGQVMTSVPDQIKEQVVSMNGLSAVEAIDMIFEQKRMLDDIAVNMADKIAKLEP